MNETVRIANADIYSRMRLIPSWDYDKCATLDVMVVGSSGLGAPILQQLVLLGIGEKGLTTLVDPDAVEPSNRSRIPFASPQDDGRSKVEVAKEYIAKIRPKREVRTFMASVIEEQVQRAIGEADIVIGAVDSEFARFVLNYSAHSFCVPYFDAGSGIFVDKDHGQILQGGGQVRAVIPGTTPCLLCNMGVSHSEVEREIMQVVIKKDQAEKELQHRSGYIRGIDGNSEEPSMANLNFFVATTLVSALLSYLLSGLPEYHSLHFDLEELSLMKSIASKRPFCPVCGDTANVLGSHEILCIEDFVPTLALMPFE